ncbi:hypothetical protein ACFWNH_25625 [Rhodococcus qingshengii]|uniref:hypothetical protein n=1 Tax=Rhodococcus qingshengii TaxID=334542 RepID=UPI0036566B1F
MAQLWMLEDLEPWRDTPMPGDTCEPTTYWASPEMLDLPAEVCCEIDARIATVTIDGRTEHIAHLGNGFTTLIGDDVGAVGKTRLRGCLVWDRYLWTRYRTQPTGRVRVKERPGHLVQHEALLTTIHPGLFNVVFDGPTVYCETSWVPTDFGVRWNTLVVELETWK